MIIVFEPEEDDDFKRAYQELLNAVIVLGDYAADRELYYLALLGDLKDMMDPKKKNDLPEEGGELTTK